MDDATRVARQCVRCVRDPGTDLALLEAALAVLEELAARGDVNMRSVLGLCGALDACAAALERLQGDASPTDSTARMRESAAGVLWSLCVAHEQNKRRCAVAVAPLVRALSDADDGVSRMAAMALWSAAYGIPENQSSIVDAGAVPLLTGLILEEGRGQETKRAATGALWHLSYLPRARDGIASSARLLGWLIASTGEREDEVNGTEHSLVAGLLLGSLSASPGAAAAIEAAGGLGCLRAWVSARDSRVYTLRCLVWTTLRPLVDLLASQHGPARELGCFLVACMARAGAEAPKLFMEGAVDALKGLARDADPAQARAVALAKEALGHLGIQCPDAAADEEPQGTHESAAEDRRPGSGSPRPAESAQACLVCCDGPREVCFVPCGHVVTCSRCAAILLARKDRCIVCRAEVATTVVPKYLS
eukprot:m51a1_g13793 hypothetical protein (421) ;mRNA; f:342637-344018